MTSRANFDLNDTSLEQCVVTFLEQVDSLERSKEQKNRKLPRMPARAEMGTLELWRSAISECLASFLYVFIVCGAASTSASAGSFPHTTFVTAAASGFTMAVLTYCFQPLSGSHVNPAVSISMSVVRKITPCRACMFVIAQVGGAIAGAALLYGVSVPAHYGNLNATVVQLPSHMSPWEKFSTEFVLTFLVVFTYCASIHGVQSIKVTGNSAICMGLAYLATGLVSMPSLNPARAFGPAFVMNRWDHQWVFWFGPIVGGVVAALTHEIIFIAHKKKSKADISVDGDTGSIHSVAETFDDLDKPVRQTNQRSASISQDYYNHRHNGNGIYGGSLYPSSQYKADRGESIYSGSRSLYTRSPVLTRANLSRSQSVYSKSNAGTLPTLHREASRPGPLIPAQSMFPIQTASNVINQNQQNQQRQGIDCGLYNTRPYNKSRNERAFNAGPNKPVEQTEGAYGSTYSYNGVKQNEPNEGAYGSTYSYNGTKQTEPNDGPYGSTYPFNGPKKNEPNEGVYNVTRGNNHQTSKISGGPIYGRKENQRNGTNGPPAYYHASRSSPNSQY